MYQLPVGREPRSQTKEVTMKNQFKIKSDVQTPPCVIKVQSHTCDNVANSALSSLNNQTHLSDTSCLTNFKMQIYTINSANQSAYWNGSQWVLTTVTNFTPIAMTFDLEGRQWLIDRSGIVGFVDEENNQVISKGKLGGWRLKELHFDLNGNKYCVSTDYKIGFWPADGDEWEDISNGVKAQSISLSKDGVLWCVDTQYRVTQWNRHQHCWNPKRLLGRRMLIQIAFGSENELYCVTADHQISVRNLETQQWQDLGSLSRWGMLFIAFKRPVSVTHVVYDLTKSNINPVEETTSKQNVINNKQQKK